MTLLQYLQKNNITNISTEQCRQLVIGKKVRILTSGYESNYGVKGTVFTINHWANPSNSTVPKTGNSSNNISMLSYLPSIYMQWAHVEIISEETIKDIEETLKNNNNQIAELEKDNTRLRLKIKFMQENNLEKFDEDEFKVYSVLVELGKKSTPIQKAQAIAKLIKG